MLATVFVVLPMHAFGEVRTTQNLETPSAGDNEKLSYKVDFSLAQTAPKLLVQLKESSGLAAAVAEGTADLGQLVARARGDLKLLRGVLFENGYYAGKISIDIDGRPLEAVQATPFLVRGGDIVSVKVAVMQGPLFRLGNVELATTIATPVAPPMNPDVYGLVQGKIAKSGLVVSAVRKIVEEWRIAGYPFAKVADKKIVADHETLKLDVKIRVDPGQAATYGWINVAGATNLAPDMVARYSGLRPGQKYTPKGLRKAGERLRKLEAVESVRIGHGRSVDSNGGVPITFDVTERKPRFIGASAALSTVDGGELQAYWGHRNLFGRAERLKVEGGVSQIGNGGMRDLQYMTRTTLTVPGVFDIDTDLFGEFTAAKERPETYESRYVRLKVGLTRVFSEALSGDVAVAGAFSRDEDVFGTSDHALVSLPTNIVSDTRDSRLDPIQGWRLSLGAEPAYDFQGDTSFVVAHAQASTYKSLDAADRTVVAARVGASNIVGSATQNVPANMRLYGGGSGTVRGYAYRSLGPQLNGEVVGGRSLLHGSVELRWRVTKQFGVVGFLDAATVSADALPSFDTFDAGAGLGLRYYTSLGPIRFDVAWPLADTAELADVAIYVGIGQAF